MTEGEKMIWRGSPSQWLNAGTYMLGGLILIVLVALMIASVSYAPFADRVGTSRPIVLIVLGALALLVVIWIVFKYMLVASEEYELTDSRLRCSKGIFSKRYDDLELYRVMDMTMFQPFTLRMVGLGNLTLRTSDQSHPNFVIPAISNPAQVLDSLRTNVEAARDRKRVRALEVEDTDDLGDAGSADAL